MLVGFAGLRGSGKDCAASVLIEEFGFTRVALADALRDVVYAINPVVVSYTQSLNRVTHVNRLQDLVDAYGWDHCKRYYEEVRRLLQATGTEAGRNIFGQDFWLDLLAKRHPDLTDDNSRYVITDCRFKNEGDWVQSNGGALIWITRPGISSDGHASESTELRAQADHEINNTTTEEDFKENVRIAAHLLGIEPKSN